MIKLKCSPNLTPASFSQKRLVTGKKRGKHGIYFRHSPTRSPGQQEYL